MPILALIRQIATALLPGVPTLMTAKLCRKTGIGALNRQAASDNDPGKPDGMRGPSHGQSEPDLCPVLHDSPADSGHASPLTTYPIAVTRQRKAGTSASRTRAEEGSAEAESRDPRELST